MDITISFPNENQYQLKGIVSRILGQPPDQLIGVRFKFDDDSSTLQFEKDIENLMVQNLGDIMFEKLFPQS